MAKVNILKRIRQGSIKTNFLDFPNFINGFKREPLLVSDDTKEVKLNYHGYTRGNDLGYVTAEDLKAGLHQVRKIDQVKPDDGTRKVAVPSNRIWK